MHHAFHRKPSQYNVIVVLVEIICPSFIHLSFTFSYHTIQIMFIVVFSCTRHLCYNSFIESWFCHAYKFVKSSVIRPDRKLWEVFQLACLRLPTGRARTLMTKSFRYVWLDYNGFSSIRTAATALPQRRLCKVLMEDLVIANLKVISRLIKRLSLKEHIPILISEMLQLQMLAVPLTLIHSACVSQGSALWSCSHFLSLPQPLLLKGFRSYGNTSYFCFFESTDFIYLS